jgi:RNA polymerase sigma-70 factor, ECF subfamily
MSRDPSPHEAFDRHRPLLFSIAYRMLGSVADAEDIVQESYMRWIRASERGVRSSKAYLSTAVTRLCLDHLRSARSRRERYVGPWLTEPLLTAPAPDAADAAALEDSLSMAFLVLLESLTLTERAGFLLREVFGHDYAEVASLVGKSEANCRQIARRTKRSVEPDAPASRARPSRRSA